MISCISYAFLYTNPFMLKFHTVCISLTTTGEMWDLTVLTLDHCLSIYSSQYKG